METAVVQARVARSGAARSRRSASRHRERATRLHGIARAQRLAAIFTLRDARHLVYDRSGPVLAMWSGGSSQSEAIGELIVRLFQVSMTLAACRALAAESLDCQLADAMHQIDGIVTDLRPFAVADIKPPGMDESTTTPTDEILDRLGVIADALHVMSQQSGTDGSLAMQLGDASHGVQRAWIAVRDGVGQTEQLT